MKTFIKLFFYLFWLISIPTIAQNNPTTTKKDGLTVVTFKTKEGTVTVNLPDNIHAGDVISGTVIAEPDKRTKKKTNKRKSEKEKNKEKDRMERLKESNLEICGTSTPITEGKFSFTVPKNVLSGVVEVELKDDKMDPIAMSSIIVHNIPRALTSVPLQVPNYLRSGYPQQIIGHFDGDFTTSSIQINDTPLEIVAESPESIIIAIPEDLVGSQELVITENEFNYTTNINIVDLNLTADKMSLSRGESTSIHLEVIGLENLEQPVIIHLDNLTPNSISLQQGNHQELFIEPEMVNEQGVFTTDYQISAQQTGGFSISAQLQESELKYADIPAPDEMNPAGPNADEKPETIETEKADIPAPDEMNPAGPNADEKPETVETEKADIPAPDEMNPAGPSADGKPETVETEKADIPAPDEMNPAGPNADDLNTSVPKEKKIGDDRLASQNPDGKKIGDDRLASQNPDGKKIGDDRLASIVAENVSDVSKKVVDADKNICGKQKTEWKEKKSERSVVGLKPIKKNQRSTSTCPVCKEKHVNWTYERVTYHLIKTYERKKGFCPKPKGHSGEHDGLKVYTKNKISKIYKDRKVRHGSCGCTTIKSDEDGWVKLEKWKKQQCK